MSMLKNFFSDAITKRSNTPTPPSAPPTKSEQPTAPTQSSPPTPPTEVSMPIVLPRYTRGGTILVFLGGSEGDALRELSMDLVRPLKDHCRNVVFVDARKENPLQALASSSQHEIWFALSFFGGGQNIEITKNGEITNLWAEAGVPFIRVFGDTPAYYPDAHVQVYPNSINLYGHPDHCEFYRRWFNSGGLSLPMSPILFDVLPERPADLSKKALGKSIVFPKNGNCPEKLMRYWRSSLPPTIRKALESLAAEFRSSAMIDKPIDIAENLVQYFSGIGIDLSEQRRLIFFMTAQLDDYLRRIKSTMITKALLDFPITVRGGGWGHVDFTGKRARLDQDSDYSRTRQIIDDSLAIIDMSPNTQHFHDRAQRAAGRYTAFLTNQQKLAVEQFENYKSFTFEFNPDSICERIDYALSNPEETVEMGVLQAEKMREIYSDARYAESLTNLLDTCALASKRPEGTQEFVSYPPERF
jgi:hypothetical protein